MRLIGPILLASVLLLANCASPQPPLRRFTTSIPQRSPLTIAVIGDQQRTSEMEVWREQNTIHADLIREVVQSRPDALILLGDQVFTGSSSEDWRFFDRIMVPVLKARIPTFPIFGNHEYIGVDEVAYSNMASRFRITRSTWYSMIMDSIGFVMLNTNFDEFSRDTAVKQLRWFKTHMRQLTENPAVRCIVVCGHHPPFTNSAIVPDEHILQQYFVPLFERSPKSRLWLSGHSHAYEHFRHRTVHYVVSGGGGGPRHLLYLEKNLRRHDDLYPGPMIRPFHFLTIQRDQSELCVTMTPLSGQESPQESFMIGPLVDAER
ncbi:MAG: metallophosphoesterase [Ignavibacteria bacterium]|nr:metallophosphoesterase [Ignavibacteria bacterium]MBL0321744.1 metallophosphoesterase [Ignavibacteria bacterium]